MSIDSSFSFDLYPGLDAELDAAYHRNVAAGTASPELVAAAGLQAVISETVAKQEPRAEIDVSPEFQAAFDSARGASMELFGRYTSITVDELSENDPLFGELDWQKLSKAYDVMQATGLEPEVVIAPQGENIKFWKKLFANLPGTKNKGLYIDRDVEKNWSDLNGGSDQNWAVSVVPATAKPPALNMPHSMTMADLYTTLGDEATGAFDLANISTPSDIYPDLRTYLTMQALRLEHGQKPLDSETFTWLRGTFDNNTKAPYAYWLPGDGQVHVDWDAPGDRAGNLGVRPAVRG